MASTLPYISREELDELEQELRGTKPGYSPDLDAFQCTILLDLILAFRQGQIVGCAPPQHTPAGVKASGVTIHLTRDPETGEVLRGDPPGVLASGEAKFANLCKPADSANPACTHPRKYFCPTSGQDECPDCGGFDVCCDRPDLHEPARGVKEGDRG